MCARVRACVPRSHCCCCCCYCCCCGSVAIVFTHTVPPARPPELRGSANAIEHKSGVYTRCMYVSFLCGASFSVVGFFKLSFIAQKIIICNLVGLKSLNGANIIFPLYFHLHRTRSYNSFFRSLVHHFAFVCFDFLCCVYWQLTLGNYNLVKLTVCADCTVGQERSVLPFFHRLIQYFWLIIQLFQRQTYSFEWAFALEIKDEIEFLGDFRNVKEYFKFIVWKSKKFTVQSQSQEKKTIEIRNEKVNWIWCFVRGKWIFSSFGFLWAPFNTI